MTQNAPSRTDVNRDALISAARRNLAEQGLAGLGFERIAASAGMTRKTVYNHFGSRPGLYEALMDDIGQRADFQRLIPVWRETDSAKLLSAFFTAIVHSWEADRVMFRMMIGLSAADPELGAAVEARIGRVHGIAAQLTRRLAAAPGLARDWTMSDATAAIFALSSFNSFDALATDMAAANVARRLTALARVPFAWS